jgi:hypothetical protein
MVDAARITIEAAPNYEINRCGHVFNTKTQKQITPHSIKSGKMIIPLRSRFRVVFTINEEQVEVRIVTTQADFPLAALVLCAFNRQPLTGEDVTFIDGDKGNVNISNLQWSTFQKQQLLLHAMPTGWDDRRTIPMCPRYALDKFGRIFNKSTGKEMLPTSDANGYLRVTLVNIKLKAVHSGVHVLTLWTWVGMPPSASHTPDHINRERTDNAIENLRWSTPAQQRANQKVRVSQCRRRVVRIDADGTRTPFASAAIAGAESGYLEKTVRAAIHQGSKTRSGGVRFEYEEDSDIIGEQWVEVTGSPGTHVSSQGRIRFQRGRITKGYNTGGYYAVCPGGQRQLVHRLVATAFVENPDPENLNVVHHKNDNKQDNRAENLQWLDQKGNVRAAVESGAKSTKVVYQFDLKTGDFICSYTSAKNAHNLTGVDYERVQACARGDQSSAGKFLWSYSADAPSCSPEAVPSKVKAVFQFERHTRRFIKEHKSAGDAKEATGVSKRAIGSCASGESKFAGGFAWTYTRGGQ